MKIFRTMSYICVAIGLFNMYIKSYEWMVFWMLYALYLKDLD